MPLLNSDQILQAVIEAHPRRDLRQGSRGALRPHQRSGRALSPEVAGGDRRKNDYELYPEDTARQFIADDRKVLATGEAQSFEGVAKSAVGEQAYLVTKGVYRDEDGSILGVFRHLARHDRAAPGAGHAGGDARSASARRRWRPFGQLTGGIAHDFNNILANHPRQRGAAARVRAARQVRRRDHRHRACARPCTAAISRGNLLAFSRRRLLNPQPVDVNALVESSVRLLGRTLGGPIQIKTETSDAAGVAFIDPGALEAAVLNVALNARDAMPAGGTLTIRTSRSTLRTRCRATATSKPGPVCRAVARGHRRRHAAGGSPRGCSNHSSRPSRADAAPDSA